MNTSSDGGDDQHEGEADHDPVLQEDGEVLTVFPILGTYTEVGYFKEVSEEANQDENHLLQENSKQVELNISGLNSWYFKIFPRLNFPCKNNLDLSLAHLSSVVKENFQSWISY